MKYVLIVVAGVVLALCGSFVLAQIPGEGRARRAAENIGLHDVSVVKRSPAFGVLGGCRDNDVTKFTVRGVANGVSRTITVCAPLVGGYTVRS